ncbi:hypothetical protein [Dyadobacter sp. CY343]|uniref:hypothetical protein n=1 Tax=Dyadobacter sp. CY343 TaxID=2907299 RepID=UPI001F383B8F|nr:hypothetical protein [Dyadobacter sp. CY343]MCE7063278.1 hypothetical protein [Dyadobacter sp. CY343]
MSARILFTITLAVMLYGCKSAKDSPKFNFADGVYHTKIKNVKQQVFIENTEDSIVVYSLKKGWKRLDLKTTVREKKAYPQNSGKETLGANKYWQNGFDIDILTIPLKFRPSLQSFPSQFSNNVNGVVYLGYRTDIYRLSYKKNPIGRITQDVKHYGLSAGFITGLGGTAMNPWVTKDALTIEYDGLVWSKGIAVLMGLNQFTFGVVGGLDHLLDKNQKVWIYQSKPYIGLAVGLNLN